LKNLVLITILIISLTVTIAFALPRIAQTHKEGFKTMLQNFLTPVIHGYGIGFTGDTYIIAKWHIVNSKILPRVDINDIIRQAKEENVTDWSVVRERIRVALEANGTIVKKGRIKIEKINYLLTNISVSETNAIADVREIPNWESCKQQNISAEDCELSGVKVGDVTITKRTKPQQEIPGEPRVWAGTMNFNGTAYTFVTLVYPRG